MKTRLFSQYPDIVSVYDLKTMLNCSNNTAYSLLRTGKIKCRKIGSIYKIPKVNVIAYITNKEDKQL